MLLAYADGRQEVLGQWYEFVPERKVTIRDVYTLNNTGSCPEKLRFVLSRRVGKMTTVLRQIAAIPSESTSDLEDIHMGSRVGEIRIKTFMV